MSPAVVESRRIRRSVIVGITDWCCGCGDSSVGCVVPNISGSGGTFLFHVVSTKVGTHVGQCTIGSGLLAPILAGIVHDSQILEYIKEHSNTLSFGDGFITLVCKGLALGSSIKQRLGRGAGIPGRFEGLFIGFKIVWSDFSVGSGQVGKKGT